MDYLRRCCRSTQHIARFVTEIHQGSSLPCRVSISVFHKPRTWDKRDMGDLPTSRTAVLRIPEFATASVGTRKRGLLCECVGPLADNPIQVIDRAATTPGTPSARSHHTAQKGCEEKGWARTTWTPVPCTTRGPQLRWSRLAETSVR